MERARVGCKELQGIVVSSSISTSIVDTRKVHALLMLDQKLMLNTA
jgi:hypothetical protein